MIKIQGKLGRSTYKKIKIKKKKNVHLLDLLRSIDEVNIKVSTLILYPISTRHKDEWHSYKTVFFNLYFGRLDLKIGCRLISVICSSHHMFTYVLLNVSIHGPKAHKMKSNFVSHTW